MATFITLTMCTWLSMRLENARRDKKARSDHRYASLTAAPEEADGTPRYVVFHVRMIFIHIANPHDRDETDRENKHFRYSG